MDIFLGGLYPQDNVSNFKNMPRPKKTTEIKAVLEEGVKPTPISLDICPCGNKATISSNSGKRYCCLACQTKANE